MARTQRNLTSSTTFHVSNRGNDRQDIFTLDCDWTFFERHLEEACARYGIRILAYAWMTNHFHMVLECADPALLPAMMRDFQSVYARAYNERTDRTGSLFEKPYFARPIIGDADLLRSARYVHLNPVDIVGEARLAAYVWSSLPVYLGRRRPKPWLFAERLSDLIEPDRYLHELRGSHPWDCLPIDQLPPRRTTPLTEVIREVDAMIEAGVGDRRDRFGLISHLGLALRSTSAIELAERLNVHPGSVRRRARDMRVRVAVDRSLEQLVDRIIAALS